MPFLNLLTGGLGLDRLFGGGGGDNSANPADPNQQLRWANERQAMYDAQLNQMRLFDPDVLSQIQDIFGPYFTQQRQNFQEGFGGAFNTATSDASRNAGALAAFRGYNPASYLNTARQGVREQMTPGFFSGLQNLQTGQRGSLLNSLGQAQRFRANNLNQMAGRAGQAQNLWGPMAYDQFNQPDLWEQFLAGTINAGGQFGSAALA